MCWMGVINIPPSLLLWAQVEGILFHSLQIFPVPQWEVETVSVYQLSEGLPFLFPLGPSTRAAAPASASSPSSPAPGGCGARGRAPGLAPPRASHAQGCKLPFPPPPPPPPPGPLPPPGEGVLGRLREGERASERALPGARSPGARRRPEPRNMPPRPSGSRPWRGSAGVSLAPCFSAWQRCC